MIKKSHNHGSFLIPPEVFPLFSSPKKPKREKHTERERMMEGVHRRPNKGDRNLRIIDVRKLSENKIHLNQSGRQSTMNPSSVKPRGMKTASESSKTSGGKSWGKKLEVKRRRRVAKYKLYTVEGKVKDSIRKGINWFKCKYTRIMSGF
ncbi:hypothetical protein Csa_006051 [Cucumis sativus]|uniref:DUF3511 domain-containing protein n=1 Tax=Cucumis sativus TaxID=3659 RepID=A0A0A0LL30_CUCSA|nr:hypothetical protein Csa_006051 [Cucumis sativus]